jgi:hypothetical protein
VDRIGLRLLIWVLPVLLYLRYVDGVGPFGYLGLRRHVGRGVAVAAGVTALNLLGSIARFGPPYPVAQSITWNSVLGTSLLVGFIEQIPYRGVILQKLAERIDFWRPTRSRRCCSSPFTCPRTTSCRSSSFTPDRAAIRVAAAESLSAARGATG